MQAPERLSVVMDDGFNVVQYTFRLQSIDGGSTAVCCQVTFSLVSCPLMHIQEAGSAHVPVLLWLKGLLLYRLQA